MIKYYIVQHISMSNDLNENILFYYFDLKLSKLYINEIKDKNKIKHKLEIDLFYLINDPLSRSY